MIDFHTYQMPEAEDVLIVELSGTLDTEASEAFFKRLDEEIGKGHLRLVFDCKKLNHISSLGFGMMIRGHTRVQKDGGAVRFARLEGLLLQTFQIVGFHKLFTNYPTIEEAVKSF